MEKSKSYMNIVGNKIWYLPSRGKNYLHRIDGPAIEYANGTKFWCINGNLHRLDCQFCSCGQEGTASLDARRIISPSGKGDSSRDDGRCVCDSHIHSNGPAVERFDGTKFWCFNGKRHRLDGPAIEWGSGAEEWYIDDVKLPTKEVKSWIKENNIDLKTVEGQIAFKLRWT